MFNRKPQIGVNFGRKADAHYPNMAAVKAQTFPEGTIAIEGLTHAGVDIYLPKEPAVTDHEYTPSMDELRMAWLMAQSRRYGNSSAGDDFHNEFDRAIAAHDAELRAEIARAWDEGFETAKRWGGAPMCKNPYRSQP